jgi:hypothetical protein
MAKAAYHVVGDAMALEPRLNAAGTGIEDVHVVPYVIDSGPARGHRGAVKVPHPHWSPEAARAAVEADVDTHHDVASISQPAPTR